MQQTKHNHHSRHCRILSHNSDDQYDITTETEARQWSNCHHLVQTERGEIPLVVFNASFFAFLLLSNRYRSLVIHQAAHNTKRCAHHECRVVRGVVLE